MREMVKFYHAEQLIKILNIVNGKPARIEEFLKYTHLVTPVSKDLTYSHGVTNITTY
ncbi:hypothetical protein RirG_091940 [Rhizophagus irregularis DAOM 197198w]|uniref:Uncharacterized protein n=1 Tax=Rhizophagus irregularis (strain DAOM 197198w) TaxID=1432141 RepID=A0A015KQP5_RHIIW|nr:hypothetical protein RirG_091940 [Rhizophagus irregularis DAOM 197198w]